jgi:hypothetical protein
MSAPSPLVTVRIELQRNPSGGWVWMVLGPAGQVEASGPEHATPQGAAAEAGRYVSQQLTPPEPEAETHPLEDVT